MADEWIVFDTAQYMKFGWVNRNRILRPSSGWQYIVVPVKRHQHYKTPINQIVISTHHDWRALILRQLLHYEKQAPYYAQVIDFLEDCFSDSESNLARLNIKLFKKTCLRLGIDKPIHVLSEMNLNLGPINEPGDWGWVICQAVGAYELINPPGGAKFINEKSYLENGIKLTIQSFTNMVYDCGRHQFEPALSILDVMMWNSCEKIKHYLDTFRL